MSTRRLTIAYSASNRIIFFRKVAGTRQPEFFNSITPFRHTGTVQGTSSSDVRGSEIFIPSIG